MKGSFWKILPTKILGEKTIIFNRAKKITAENIGQKFNIYNGIRFFEILILEKMLGRSFGEFAPTRKFPSHKKKK